MAVKVHDCSNHQHVEREHDHSNAFPLLINVFKLVRVALLVLHEADSLLQKDTIVLKSCL